MRIAIMGSGGVGGYFGARLALGGADVTFIARGAHLAAMRQNGLRVESPLGDLHVANPQVTDAPATIGPVDLVLFSVKLWDTEVAARAVAPLIGPDTGVISFQNGVHKDEVLRRVLGERAVMGGVSYIAATIGEPGLIRHAGKLQKLVFGEYDGQHSSRAKAFLDACLSSGIEAELNADIRRAIWEKFVFLVGLSGTTTTIRKSIGPIRSHPQTRALLLDAMREVVAVGRAQGVALAEDFADNRLAFCDSLPAEMTSSMHHDLERGNRLEVQWLSGDVAERGRAMQIPTPVNRAIYDILALQASGNR
ncbi:ketopantoate reductase family protein [Noviherbaspirillum sp.]|uniref:ketopantoate reductase family protein n=1 Tax=Noviherbaspirillum sp. TaxID=1926288 RepID=UPI002B484805|nr:ketopantoate reductase family protein [Noviherbaspirillum sp.]HJV79358.1 ketopantoate reductase family protein [Noviherbaspirillum sp.]